MDKEIVSQYLYDKYCKEYSGVKEWGKPPYKEWLEQNLFEAQAKSQKSDSLPCVRLSLDFAEWIDIYGIRDGEHEWKYKGDNYTKKYSTQEMFNEWQSLLTNEA